MSNKLWLPLITPFKDGAVDYPSYERLVAHAPKPPPADLVLR